MTPQNLVNDYLAAGKKFKKAFIATIITLFVTPLTVTLVVITSQSWPLVFFLLGPICCLIVIPEVFRYIPIPGVFLYHAIPFIPLDILGFLMGVLLSIGIIISFPWVFCIIAMCNAYKEKKEARSNLEANNIPLPEKDRSKIQLISLIASIVTVYLAIYLAAAISAYIDTHPRYSKLDKELLESYNFYEVTGGYAISAKNDSLTGSVEIPLMFNNETVVAIADNGFENCKIDRIVFPSTICEIGDSAFKGCVGLMEIVFPQNLELIETSAFEGCSSLTRLTIPENISIDSYAFKDCTGLKEVLIGSGVKEERVYTKDIFEGCDNLVVADVSAESVSLINGLNIRQLTLRDVSDDNFGFTCKHSLETVILKGTATTIDTNCFYECENLKKLVIPSTIKVIQHHAFRYCDSLEEILFDGTVKDWSEIEISDNWLECTPVQIIHCSDGEIEIVY